MLADDKVGEPVPLLEVPHAPAQVLVLADIALHSEAPYGHN